jgi:DegV family protein with EDD domain
MSHILVMTDSTCDLPAEWVRRFDIRVVPTYVHFGLESLADDGIHLTRPDFYRRLSSSSVLPTTSAPPPGEVLEAMQRALEDADHVIAIIAPLKLSGIYNTFHVAAEQTAPERVTLIDSGTVSMGMGWQVVMAAEMAQEGASPADIKAAVLAVQPRTDVWAALDTLEYVRRGGRVGWAAAMVGEFLQIKPIIRLHNGEITSVTRVRTSQRAFQTLVDIAHQAAPLERLAVMHSHYLDGGKRLLEALVDIHPDHEPVVVDATPVLGVHVGQNGLGLGVVRKR